MRPTEFTSEQEELAAKLVQSIQKSYDDALTEQEKEESNVSASVIAGACTSVINAVHAQSTVEVMDVYAAFQSILNGQSPHPTQVQ